MGENYEETGRNGKKLKEKGRKKIKRESIGRKGNK